MLVDFICKDKEILLVSKLDDCFNVFSCQNLSGWVAWIDDDNCPYITLLLTNIDWKFLITTLFIISGQLDKTPLTKLIEPQKYQRYFCFIPLCRSIFAAWLFGND